MLAVAASISQQLFLSLWVFLRFDHSSKLKDELAPLACFTQAEHYSNNHRNSSRNGHYHCKRKKGYDQTRKLPQKVPGAKWLIHYKTSRYIRRKSGDTAPSTFSASSSLGYKPEKMGSWRVSSAEIRRKKLRWGKSEVDWEPPTSSFSMTLLLDEDLKSIHSTVIRCPEDVKQRNSG